MVAAKKTDTVRSASMEMYLIGRQSQRDITSSRNVDISITTWAYEKIGMQTKAGQLEEGRAFPARANAQATVVGLAYLPITE